MDVSRFRVGDWVLAAAGVVMLVLGLAVHWATIDANGRSFGGARSPPVRPFPQNLRRQSAGGSFDVAALWTV